MQLQEPSNPDPNFKGGQRRRKIRRLLWLGALLIPLGLVIATEIIIRAQGVVDFPTYVRDPQFGYFPKAGQSGTFGNKNRWVFNDRGMGIAAPWRPSDRSDILLIGNSVVSGGNAYDQPEKLASQLQGKLGENCPVWPVAVGGWTAVNAVQYLLAHPDLIDGSDFFVWEYMPSQMDHANPWASEARSPTHVPIWATGYVLNKILTDRMGLFQSNQTVPVSDIQKNYDDFEKVIGRLAKRGTQSPRGIIFAFPTRDQWLLARSGHDWLPDRQRLARLAQVNDVLLLDLAAVPLWTEGMYWDHVHPNPFGNVVLASVLSELVTNRAPFLKCKAGG